MWEAHYQLNEFSDPNKPFFSLSLTILDYLSQKSSILPSSTSTSILDLRPPQPNSNTEPSTPKLKDLHKNHIQNIFSTEKNKSNRKKKELKMKMGVERMATTIGGGVMCFSHD